MSWWLWLIIGYFGVNIIILIWAFISTRNFLSPVPIFEFWQIIIIVLIFVIFGIPITIYGLVLEIIERGRK